MNTEQPILLTKVIFVDYNKYLMTMNPHSHTGFVIEFRTKCQATKTGKRIWKHLMFFATKYFCCFRIDQVRLSTARAETSMTG